MDSIANKQRTSLETSLGTFGAVIGASFGQYLGIHLLAPGIIIVIIALVLKKWGKASFMPYAGAFSVQAGQEFWIVLATILGGQPMKGLPDLVLFGGGLAWLASRPGVNPLLYLGILQTIMVGFNILTLVHAVHGSLIYKAMMAHVFIRLFAVVFMLVPIWQLRRTETMSAM